jgi:hypothetical protein
MARRRWLLLMLLLLSLPYKEYPVLIIQISISRVLKKYGAGRERLVPVDEDCQYHTVPYDCVAYRIRLHRYIPVLTPQSLV